MAQNQASEARPTVFEVSWEVCNKVGGIHTVLSSKALTAVERLGDGRYWAVGPWLLSDTDRNLPFEDDPGYAEFVDACRSMGLPVRVGRWTIPGRPRCILIEFSSLYDRKDAVLAQLWEDFEVDSIAGAWDYVEPVLFGHAAGLVLEEFWDRYLAPEHGRAIVHAHEWMTGSALLHARRHVPAIGTVFTTHATALGRTLSSLGHSPESGLGERTPEDLAREHGMRAKHSIETVSAREADVFTTVSQVTAKEAELLLGRAAVPILPNGIDLDVVDELATRGGETPAVRARLEDFATRFLGISNAKEAAFVAISGRYEFHNKGIDLFLDALAQLDREPGRPVVAWVLVPAGNSGLRSEVRERLTVGAPSDQPVGIATHHLFDEEHDPVRRRCAELGLDNAPTARVHVVHVPVYLAPGDGFLDASYEAVLAAMDLGVFPSFYEPWGYTPQEALALGVPTITSDYAGFGRFAESEALGREDGVTVLHRLGRHYDDAVRSLHDELGEFFATSRDAVLALRDRARAAARRTDWSDLFRHYESAYAAAAAAIENRMSQGAAQTRKPRRQVVTNPVSARRPHLQYFDVSAVLPEPLRPLERIARNLWWCWDHDVPQLFREISPTAWDQHRHNPLRFLRHAFPDDLRAKAADPSFCRRVAEAEQRFDAYIAARCESLPVGDGSGAISQERPVAYFCAEFGFHESLPIYSGGLGILAGDHLKSASDLNIPLIGVGLFYRYGYMGQSLTADGQQVAVDRENEPRDLPLELLRGAHGEPLEVRVPMPGRDVALRAYRCRVGRVDLYLLDANTPSNHDEDREITRNLYGGDHETRIRQLIALGRGGVRLLDELGIEPSAWHMNEGHAAFLTLERLGRLVRRQGQTFGPAREAIRTTTAFTTHTPVPAGHDRFSEDLMRRYFSDVPDSAGVPWERFLRFGRADEGASDFNMSYLALTFSSYCNGVSKLHGIASRELLHPYWPNLLREEVPVDSVTNGIHLPTWTHPRIAALLGKTDGPVQGTDFTERAASVDPAALWRTHCDLKADLRARVAQRMERAFVARNDSPVLLSRILDGLDEDALWIGFARRFAPYKRAQLLYKDPARLARLLDSTDRPVRILVAGKAHPRDQHGQDILRSIASLSRGTDLSGRVIFVEDYDIDLARSLVQGVDVWLNTPTRMLEASGTSGMKVAANGGLNLSIADGWWPEGADGENGWTIGSLRKVYQEQELQDQLDAETLYQLLEEQVVPCFYERDADGIPQAWVAKMIHCLQTLPAVFDTDRMVGEYLDKAYRDLAAGCFANQADRDRARRIADEAQRIRRGFDAIRILEVRHTDIAAVRVGDTFEAAVRLDLGPLAPDDVEVEVVLGNAQADGELVRTEFTDLAVDENAAPADAEGLVFRGTHQISRSGRYGVGIRIRPRRGSASPSALRDLVLWA
ncbi:MAG: alpha-glucan family phosphorylase [Planctomycetota bacterium]